MEKIRLDRPDRASENVRDLLVRHLMVHPEDQRRALFARELRDGRPNSGGPLLFEYPLGGRFRSSVYVLSRLDRFARRRLGADPVQADIHPDAIQPRAERRPPAKAAKTTIR